MGDCLCKIGEFIFPCLAKEAKYIYELKDNLDALLIAGQTLEAKSADLLNDVEIQETHGLEPLEEVKRWFLQVHTIGPWICRLLDAKPVQLQRLCMGGYWSKECIKTHLYGKLVFKTLERVESLLSSIPSGPVARIGLPPSVERMPSKQHILGLETMLDAIRKRLMENEVGILGLYGLGGVGKTTLLHEIINKHFAIGKEFGFVIYVEVSQNVQIGKIQEEIGKRIGICNDEWNLKAEKEKAKDIHRVLTKKRFVMILDDIWEKVKLEEIGIPIPSTQNKSKVVIATRSREVCGNMGIKVEMEVKCLGHDYAWELFRIKVGDATLSTDPNIPGLARIICGKCEGLPLALNVIGETMSGKRTVQEWQHAVDTLQLSAADFPNVEDKILGVLMLSYNYLTEKVQQCFRYYALFPEDSKIAKDDLVDYWVCEGITKGTNEGYDIIGTLVNASLLMNFEEWDDFVKMHDVIRQLAIWIAFKDKNLVVETGDKLSQIPVVNDWNVVRRMSLDNNEIKNISEKPNCQNLTTLFLKDNKLVNISGEFFQLMPKLVVLNLSGNSSLSILPEEVSNLVVLQYLNLSKTKLKKLPEGLRRLVKLKHLNLNFVTTLKSLSVVSSLLNLETLKLYHSIGLTLEFIKDLQLMKNLKVLMLTVKEDHILKSLMGNPKLASCTRVLYLKGSITKLGKSFGTVFTSLHKLEIRDCTFDPELTEDRENTISIHTNPATSICFQNLRFVNIANNSGLEHLTWLLFAQNLSTLSVKGSGEITEILNREKAVETGILMDHPNIKPFPKLHTLALKSLPGLTSIYWEPLAFPSLRKITVQKCPNLKKLPLNKESAEGNHIRLIIDNEEWLNGVEWEDEDTRDRFCHSYEALH